MAAAPAVVCAHGAGRSAGGRFFAGRGTSAIRVSGPAAGPSGSSFRHLRQRWGDLFDASFDVLLYDLTSTYFESDPPCGPSRTSAGFGYSRDKRSDCVQVVIALVVTPEGFPAGLRSDGRQHRRQHHAAMTCSSRSKSSTAKPERIWVMDRGIPTEEVLGSRCGPDDPPVQLLGGHAQRPAEPV